MFAPAAPTHCDSCTPTAHYTAATAATNNTCCCCPPLPLRSPPLPRLSGLVCRNALLELSQDLTTAAIRGDPYTSLTGLWPLLSLFNHSCAPNAVAVTIGYQQPQQQQQYPLPLLQQQQQASSAAAAAVAAVGGVPVNPWTQQGTTARSSNGSNGGSSSGTAAVSGVSAGGLFYCCEPGVGPFVAVRAVSDLAPGDEVLLDYLAGGLEGSLVHGERRRAALGQRWGFKCRCGGVCGGGGGA